MKKLTVNDNENTLVKELTEWIRESFGAEPKHPWARYPDHTTFEVPGIGKWFALVMRVTKKQLGLPGGEAGVYVVNVKADPDFISFMAGKDGFLRAYHMNKEKWITILLDGTVPLPQVKSSVETSFLLVSDTPAKRIYEAVKKIPRGKVATYGDVAAMAGDRKMARAVGNALHKNPDPDGIPCYRVVNAQGKLAGEYAFGGEWEQAKLLRADGIEVVDGAVDLSKYRM